MANFLTDLAKTYVEKLINGALKESCYICCFNCIAKEFEEEKVRLEAERTTVRQRVAVATRRGEDVQANALFWEEEANVLIQEDTKTKKNCFFGFCPSCIWRYRRGKDLANKKEKIKELMKSGNELAIGLPARLPDVERYSSQHYISFKSREAKYKELLDSLGDDNIYITGLQGMGGTGKTTLAKQVGKELKESKQFTHVIDTTMSNIPDIKKIQDDIAGPLGLIWDECSESDRPKKIWSRLTNGEKILLIFDDVWGDIDFDEIGIPYSDNHKGCRILVTTRNVLVCNKIGCSKTIQLELLSKEDAWIMFKRYAGLSDISAKSLFDKGRKIANECKRLPVAIAAIASSLKGQQRQEEWDVALKSLQKHMSIHDVDDDLVKVYKCLKFSYDNMQDENTKRLFLLCSVFQEDKEIFTEMLTRFFIGAGLFGEDYGSYNDARSQVVRSKNKLLDSCLLLEVNRRSVKMHDLVRDVAQWIADKDIQTVNLDDKNQKALIERENKTKYLLCEGKLLDVLSCKFDGSKLEILIVIVHQDIYCKDKKVKALDSFFENNTGLRVFHLFNNIYKPDLSLPQSIQSWKNIRSLIFTHFKLGDISIIGNLKSLETLDFHDCKIHELPHGITKLEKLRLVNLEDCEIERNNPFDVIERCSSLEELYFTCSFNDFCREITFPKLQRFCVDDHWKSANASSSKYVSVVDKDEVFLSETTLKYCMQTAEVLRLRRIERGWRNLIPEIVSIDQGMNDTVELSLSFISQIQYLVDTKHIINSQVTNVFSKLVVLNLYKLENLEELCNGFLSFDSLSSLEKLSIKDCKHLRSLFKCNLNLCNLKSVSLWECPLLISLFQLSTARSLVLLERLEIVDCVRLEHIIIIDERKEEEEEDISREEIVDNDNGSESHHGSMFQKLEVLKIKKCPEIEIILPFLSTVDLPALGSISVKSCDKLKYIFGEDVELGSLQQMRFASLPNLIDIFPKQQYGTVISAIKGPSSISRDTSKPQTPSDPIKCNIFSWNNLHWYGKKFRVKMMSTTALVSKDQLHDNLIATESNSYISNLWERAQCLSTQSHILYNIKKITLSNISKIKSVFILSVASRMLLETLIIVNCDELKHVIIDTGDHDSTGGINLDVFPKLDEFYIEYCTKLEYIIGHCYDHDHQNENVIHFHLPELEDLILSNLPSLVAICPEQYHTTFPPLKVLKLDACSPVANIKSIGDIITHHCVTRSVDGTIVKESSGSIEHFLVLETLMISNSKVESIIGLNEANEQQINLGLQDIEVQDQPLMTCLFVDPKNSFSLENLTSIQIVRCEKLEFVFSKSILRCLPQLLNVRIEECKELKYMIEDDLENKQSSNYMSSRTCFKKLNALAIVKCNKLKHVFPVSVCKEFAELEAMMISEADELEEIFKSEGDDQIVETPNLKLVVFVKLPSLCHGQGIQFQAVQNRLVKNCQNLSLSSAATPFASSFAYLLSFNLGLDYERYVHLENQFKKIREGYRVSDEFASGHKSAYLRYKSMMARVKEGNKSTNAKTITSSIHLDLVSSSSDAIVTSEHTSSSKEYGNGQIAIEDVDLEGSQKTTKTNNQGSLNDDSFMKVSSNINEHISKDGDVKVSKSRLCSIASKFPSKGFPDGTEVQVTSRDELISLHENGIESNVVDTKMKQTAEGKQEFVENVSGLKMPSVENSDCLKVTKDESIEESSTTSVTTNEPHIQIVDDLKQKGIEISVEDNDLGDSQETTNNQELKGHNHGNENPNAQTTTEFATRIEVQAALGHKLTSSQEDVDGKIFIPSFSIVNTKLPATKGVDIGDSQAMEDINNMIEDDPLLALEKLLTGVQSFSIGSLLQELKTLMDSSSDPDHLVSNQESKSKLTSLFHGLNQHQGILPSDVKEFVERVQNFFNDNIIKRATYQQILKKHNQLLDSKTDLMNKLCSAKSTQTQIDSETSTTNDQIHDLSLQIDEIRKKLEDLENQRDSLKLVVNKCDVQKMKLKAECTEWAQKSKKLLSALVSSEVDAREAECARNLAKEDFANLKSLFPTF